MNPPTSSSLQLRLERLLAGGTKEDVFPGAAAVIIKGHGERRFQAMATAGVTRLDDKGVTIEPDTLFDLASLTKPLATTLGILLLVDQDRLRLDDRLIDLCPSPVPPDKEEITLAQLLSHSSGLASYHEYYKLFPPDTGRNFHSALIGAILNAPLDYPIGTECRYSDLGFILLGDILEQTIAGPLHDFFQQKITAPLGLENEIFFLPITTQNTIACKRFAATEYCPWRGRVLQGEVHDEHCHLLDGVAGHAGLFGTASTVGQLCQTLLDTWLGRPTCLNISKKTLVNALKPQYPEKTWCLGFDTPSPTGYTSASKYLTRHSIGHLGYTGTSFWIDPEREVILILLTNRVHLGRENKKIREFRPWFHDQVMSFIINGK